MRNGIAFTLILSLAAAAFAGEGPSPAPPRDADLPRLIDDLGSLQFDTREAAEGALARASATALPALRKARAETTDIEVVDRLRRVVSVVQWRHFDAIGERKVSFDIRGKGLRDALRAVEPDLAELGFRSTLEEGVEVPVSFRAKEMPLKHAVAWIMRLAGAEALAAQEEMVRKDYSIEGCVLGAQELVDLIKSRLLARDFSLEGSDISENGGALAVRHDERTQAKVREVLEKLRKQAKEREIRLRAANEAGRQDLSALMRRRVSLQFDRKPVAEALAYLQEHTDAPLALAPGIALAQPAISLIAQEMEVGDALKWVARACGGECSVRDGAFFIATKGRAAEHEIRIYNVEDMTSLQGDWAPMAEDISDMLRNRVHPESWDDERGARIEEREGRLIAGNTPEVLEETGRLLERFREFLAQMKQAEPDGKPPAKPLEAARVPRERFNAPRPADESGELAKALKTPVTFEFVDKPLSQALRDIARQARISIAMEADILENESDRTPIMLRVTDMEAAKALDWVLRLAELEYELRDGAVYVCRKQSACGCELRTLYARDMDSIMNADELTKFFQGRVYPARFADPCTSIETRHGLLWVMQTPQTLGDIERVMAHLRAHAGAQAVALDETAYPQRKANREKLDAAVLNFKARKGTLQEFLDGLAAASGLSVDYGYCNAEDFEKETHEESLAAPKALEHALRRHGLEYSVTERGIAVGRPADITPLAHRLVLYRASKELAEAGMESLAGKLMAAAGAKAWGEGMQTSIEQLGGATLLVRQSAEAQALILDELKKLEAGVEAAEE